MIAQYETKLKYRKTDENGDMVFGGGDSDFLDGAAAMEQVLKTRLAVIDGEWWEGDEGAMPWTSEVLGQMVTQNRINEIDLMVIDRIMDTIGVISVSNIESGVTNRQYYFRCMVQTIYGSVQAEAST